MHDLFIAYCVAMNYFFKAASISLCLAFLPSLARAEAYFCDGIWTETPCDAQRPTPMPKQRTKKVDLSLAQKAGILHELRTQLDRIKHDYQLSIEGLSEIEDFCRQDSQPVDSCRRKAEQLKRRIRAKQTEIEFLREYEAAQATSGSADSDALEAQPHRK